MASAENKSRDLSWLSRMVRVLASLVFILGVQTIHAGSATWSQTPANGDWNEPSNWVPATVPNDPADVATFGASNLTSISISENFDEQLNGITFNSGASPFTITIAEPPGSCCFTLTINGVGIVNNSGITQNFVSNSAFSGHGQFRFTGNSTAGSSTVFTNNGAGIGTFDPFTPGVAFVDTATAGSGVFINNPGSVPGTSGAMPGAVSFDDNATAGHGTFINNGAGNNIPGPNTRFFGNASAGEGSFTNNGATATTSQVYNGGITSFQETSTAANATITANGGLADPALGGALFFRDNSTAGTGTFSSNPGEVSGASGGLVLFSGSASADSCTVTSNGSSLSGAFAGRVQFNDTSSAANSTITSKGGSVPDAAASRTIFLESSTAGNATLVSDGGSNGGQAGQIQFEANATGGTARVALFGNGSLTIAAHNAPGVTIGSLEGSGIVVLGNNNLMIGSRNNSTNFSGVIQDGGSLTKIGTGTLTLSGANTYTGATTVNAGKLAVDGSIMSAVTVSDGGTLGGSGTTGSVTVNSSGAVAPGGSQTLHINGNYTQNAGGLLKIEVAGNAPNASGRLDITGSATVDGTLEVRFVNGLLPISGQVIEVLHVDGAFAGSFAQIIFPDLRAGFQFQAEFVNGIYRITALNDGAAAIGFLNISTRMRVGTGDNALIGGFIVTANPSTRSSGPSGPSARSSEPSGATKRVIIRAIGPSLAPLPGRLADPTLELRDNSGGLIFANDNWVESPQAQEIIDSTIPPSDDLEAAIAATLAPGSYTAVMRGANNTAGIGVVEVYDLTLNVPASLANISSRGLVETGDNVMIGGFIVDNQASHVIVRALGPSLTPFGIPNALADPTLTLHNGDGAIIAFNDDWQETNQAAIEATGIPPTNDKESAILATLAPGPHTAIVRGQNDTTGVGLVEVYKLP